MRHPFTVKEYKSRIRKIKKLMKAQGIDVLIASDPSNMNWLTGYDGWSFYVHQGVIISLDTSSPIWFGRLMDRNAARIKCYMHEEHLIGYPEEYVQNLNKHPMSWLAENVFIPRDWHRATIGTEYDNYYYSAEAHFNLKSKMPKARFADSENLVNWARAIKSEQELEYMTIAAKITARIHQRILDIANVGIPKSYVVSQIYETAISGVDGHGGDYPSIVPLLPSGKEASASHITWDEKPFKKNENTFFEISGCYKRYHSPMCRTIYMGKPDKKFLNAEKASIEAIEAGMEVAKAGNTAGDVARTVEAIMKKHGIDRKGARAGYPVGVSYPPDWGERSYSIRCSDETILEENMTFHFMPGIWQDDWGLEMTETVVVTDSGAKPLYEFPRKMFVK